MNTTTNTQSQKPETTYEPKEQLTFSFCIGYNEKVNHPYDYPTEDYEGPGGGEEDDNLEDVQNSISEYLLDKDAEKHIFKIEIWINGAEEYDKIEFPLEERGYSPDGKVIRAYGKKKKECYEWKCDKCDKWLKTTIKHIPTEYEGIQRREEQETCCGEPIYQEE